MTPVRDLLRRLDDWLHEPAPHERLAILRVLIGGFVTVYLVVNAGGYKAVGESGPIGAMPAVYAAVLDAVSHLGVTELPLPITPHALWRALRE